MEVDSSTDTEVCVFKPRAEAKEINTSNFSPLMVKQGNGSSHWNIRTAKCARECSLENVGLAGVNLADYRGGKNCLKAMPTGQSPRPYRSLQKGRGVVSFQRSRLHKGEADQDRRPQHKHYSP